MRTVIILFVLTIAGCAPKTDTKKENREGAAAAVNADPKGNLEKIWQAWRMCESKNGSAPQEGGMFDKYLKNHGTPSEILKGIGIRWAISTREPSMREAMIAWQETSKSGKYYALFASGKIDLLDEDEMESRGVVVGKHRAVSDQFTQDNFKERLKENEDDWAQTKKMFDEDEQKDDAFEKQLQKPDPNPANEAVRKMNLPHEMKALVQRRQARQADLEVKRKVYEQQKKRLEEQLKK
jgi:hypothetical protein